MLSPTTVLTIQNVITADSQCSADDKKWINTVIQGPAHLVPAKKAAELLGIHSRTFFRHMKDGKLKLTPIKRNSKVVLYQLDEVMAERIRAQC